MSVWTRAVTSSLLVCIIGAIFFIASCSTDYFRYNYDHSAFLITHIIFYVGLVLFFSGIINLLRLLFMGRTAFSGITVARMQARRAPPTSVTVIGTVMPAGPGSDTWQQPHPQTPYPVYDTAMPKPPPYNQVYPTSPDTKQGYP